MKHLAIDIGASSGRHVLGWIEDGKIRLEEVYRFENGQVRKDGHDCWDIDRLVASVKAGIDAALERGPVDTFGIDTWGVDFVLVGEDGRPCSDAVAYRDARTAGADAEIEREVMPFADLYARAGIQKAPYNTIYQLWALKKEHPEQLEKAAHLMMVPEYLTYSLTGRIVHDYTISSTTSLLDAAAKDWDFGLIDALGLPRRIFGSLSMPGADAGEYRGVKAIVPAMHDTASAYLAVPARDDRAVYLSSGTWSLLGVERTEALTTDAAREANFTNEGGAWGRYRFLKNIMGLWMVQSVRRELNGAEYVEGRGGDATEAALAKLADYERGRKYSFADLESMARASGYAGTVPADDARFLSPASMIGEVMSAASERGGEPPRTVGDVVLCVYRSLAASYAAAVAGLRRVTGTDFTSMNIVGGGSKDGFLNELTAKATGLEVFAGPTEGTAIGNLVVQMVASGEFADLASARAAIVR